MQKASKNEAQPPLIEGRRVYALAGHMLFAAFDSGGVLFNLENRESHRLNPTGASVVGLLDGRRNVSTVTAVLSRENGLEACAAKADIERFLTDMLNRGWIHD